MTTPAQLPGTAADYFGGMVESYDSLIRRAIPRYDEMTQRLLDYLPAQPRRILELGCGTGNLTLKLAFRYPAAAITTVDAAPQMTQITTVRAQRQGSHVEAITATFEAVSFAPQCFDLVTSCMSLHHVADKAPLYNRIASWLAPGGALVFADQVASATPEAGEVDWGKWLEFCRAPGNCTEVEIDSLVGHSEAHDHYTKLEEHFRLMSHVGFHSLDCVWRNWMYGVVTARR